MSRGLTSVEFVAIPNPSKPDLGYVIESYEVEVPGQSMD
jgi:hypothetical protein